ncbi:gtpase binding protein rid1 [Pyrenophora tritici-repentis]|nr:gtpase binding protein rid1 [Pyrenophora tritici-repentis]
MATPGMAPPVQGHRRNRSAVLRSIITSSRGHRRSPTDSGPLSSNTITSPPYLAASGFHAPLLPPDHPHSQLRAANQTENTTTSPPSPRKSQSSPRKSLNKKTLSAVSLRSLAKREDKPRVNDSFDSRRSEEEAVAEKPKRPKSSSNLATMFGKRRDKSPVKESRDKENTTPPRSSHAQAPPRTPIWAEFSSQQQVPTPATSKMSNEERRSIEDEIALYTPRDYSPTKQRNFFDYGLPALRPSAKERPKSMVVPKTISTASLLETFSRKKSGERVPLSDTKGNEGRARGNIPLQEQPHQTRIQPSQYRYWH